MVETSAALRSSAPFLQLIQGGRPTTTASVNPSVVENKPDLFITLPLRRLCFAFTAMSENYVVFIEQPIKLDLLKFILYRIQGKSFHKVMSWEPDLETVFHVIDRRTGQACTHTLFT